MLIICNEEEYAKNRLKEKNTGENIYQTLSVLARYFYTQGMPKREIRTTLHDFMVGVYPKYEEEKEYWSDYIDRCASRAKKRKLFVSDGVMITVNEWRTIERLKTLNLRKLAFTLICIAKLNNIKNQDNNNWVNMELREIFRLADIRGTNDMRANRLRDLINAGIITLANRIDNLNIRVSIIECDGSQKHKITDFSDLGGLYTLMTDTNYTRCAQCGKVIKKTKNRKYCDECGKYEKKPEKEIECVDCGTHFIVSAMNNKTCRCAACQSTMNREKTRIRKRRYDLKKVTIAI